MCDALSLMNIRQHMQGEGVMARTLFVCYTASIAKAPQIPACAKTSRFSKNLVFYELLELETI